LVSFLHSSRLSSGHSSGLPSGPSIQHPARRAPFSFADDLLDQTQPVNVTLWGFEYPGEVIVAERWRAEFGEALSGVSMFRLVLLHTPEAPTPDDIADDRICVAAPRVSSQMIGETRATYLVDGAGKSHSERSSARPGQQDGRNLFATDLRTLREVRQNYITANDPGLGRLASALAMFESQANASVAADLHKMWKTGVVVTSNHRTEEGKTDWTGPKIQPGELFLLEDPESWIESAAAVLDMGVISGIAGAFGISGDLVSPVRIYDELKNGRLADARVHLRQLCGIQIDELTPGDQIKALVENGDGEVSGDALIQLLIHELRYPPAIASLWLVVHALDSGGELVLFEAGAGRVDTESAESRREYLQGHLSGDTISEFEHDADLITRTMNFRSEKSGDWDAVLPFLRLVAPEANFTAFGGGRDSDSIEFGLQLEALHGRLRQAKPAMLRLEVAVGSTDHPLTRISEPLKKVLSVESWQEYVVRAREIYGSVGALRTALNDAAHQWSATEYSPDIERTVYYLDQVEFGRGDHALAVEHRALRSRFDLTTLIENPSRWRALRSEFERWRQEYRVVIQWRTASSGGVLVNIDLEECKGGGSQTECQQRCDKIILALQKDAERAAHGGVGTNP